MNTITQLPPNQAKTNRVFTVRNLRYPGNTWLVLAASAEEAKAVVVASERRIDFIQLAVEETTK